MKLSLLDISFYVICSFAAFAYGDYCGRKKAHASHLLFDMAIHRGALSQFDNVQTASFLGGQFELGMQQRVLGNVISEIDSVGFQNVLRQSGNHDNEDLLWMIYRNSKRCLGANVNY